MGFSRALAVSGLIVAACGGKYGENGDTSGEGTPPPSSTAAGADAGEPPPETPCTKKNCGPHATCTVQGTEGVCSCARGYVLGGAPDAGADPTKCAWGGGPLDPGFQNDPAGTWTTADHAVLMKTFAAPIDFGALIFDKGAGTAQQLFQMPAYADAEPLAMTLAMVCESFGEESNDCYNYDDQLGFNGRFHRHRGTTKRTVCLGERAYGGPLLISLGGSNTNGDITYGYDRVTIDPAPSCPPLGTIPNGDFEGVGGWTAVGAEIAVGTGTNGSKSGHLHMSKGCDEASLEGAISVPSASLKSPAIRMSIKGSAGDRLRISMGEATFAVAAGKGAVETQTLCLPQWSRGLAMKLRFDIDNGALACGAAAIKDFFLDDLAIVSDSKCADDLVVVDGGFESTSSITPWLPSLQGDTTTSLTTTNPHAGTQAAVISSSSAQCAQSSFSQLVTVPDKGSNGGPMLAFWYRTSGTNVTFDTPGANPVTSPSTAWAYRTMCLDPKLAGQSYGVSFGFHSAGAGCSSPALFIDDVDVVHSPTCSQ